MLTQERRPSPSAHSVCDARRGIDEFDEPIGDHPHNERADRVPWSREEHVVPDRERSRADGPAWSVLRRNGHELGQGWRRRRRRRRWFGRCDSRSRRHRRRAEPERIACGRSERLQLFCAIVQLCDFSVELGDRRGWRWGQCGDERRTLREGRHACKRPTHERDDESEHDEGRGASHDDLVVNPSAS
jgi:hypothetical protein